MHRRFSRSAAGRRLLRWSWLPAAASLAVGTPLGAQLPAPPVVGSGPLQAGGYLGLTISRPEHPEEVEKLDVSELVAAVMAWGQISPRASYLVELDMAKRTAETWTGRESDQRLTPVRMYLEYAASDLLRVRMGRFLTPLGQWNERHAEPLTWTPTRPLTTYRPFAKSLTGVLLAGESALHGMSTGYTLFWAPSANLDRRFDEREESAFAHALGARVALELRPGLTVGFDMARLRRSQPTDSVLAGSFSTGSVPATESDRLGDVEREDEAGDRALLGGDVRWVHPGLELSIEGSWLLRGEGTASEGGVFTQGAVRVGGPVWAVARAELYTPVEDRRVTLGYVGIAVRGPARTVAKIGRQFSQPSSSRIPDGWFLSFSSLF